MNNPYGERLKWFNAALKEKYPDTTVEDLSSSVRIDPELFQGHIENATEPDTLTEGVVRGILGCSINEFVENGRAICGFEPQSAPSSSVPPAGEVAELLAKARQILEKGGDNAISLKNMIKLMK